MLRSIGDLYRQAWAYALACPLLFLVPVAAEAAQHFVEHAQGFYEGRAGARAVERSTLRMGFGTVKVLALLIEGYWMTRWLAWRRPERTAGFDRRSLMTFAPLFAFSIATGLPQIWGPALSPALGRPALFLGLTLFFFGVLLSEWSRTAALGEEGGPIASIRLCASSFLWGLGFDLVAILPAMFVHYALGYGAMKATGPGQFAMLAVDTVFVGYLGAIVSGIPWYVSERARHLHADARRPDRRERG